MSVRIVAEVGSNHDGTLFRAKDLIHRSKEAGATAVKFQLFRAQSLCERRNAWDWYSTYKAYEMPDWWLPLLKEYADKCGIEFMCTAYDRWGFDTVDPFVTTHKVASFEAMDLPLLTYVAAKGKPMIVSTGMCTDREAARIKEHCNLVTQNVAILYCVSAYPTPWEALRLHRMTALYSGLSDHSPGPWAGIAAVARGAEIVEKHVTDDPSRPGPDHSISIDFAGFKQMTDGIRAVEQTLRDDFEDDIEQGMRRFRVRDEK